MNEELARKMYSDYSDAVGGKAFDGKKLPSAEEFFTDEKKTKQADAWRVVAKNTLDLLHPASQIVVADVEQIVVNELAIAYTKFMSLPDLSEQDQTKFCNKINDLQDMMHARLYREGKPAI